MRYDIGGYVFELWLAVGGREIIQLLIEGWKF